MSQFSSGKHKAFASQSRWGNHRPTYTRLSNPANPILAAFRDYLGRTPFQMPRTLAHLFLRDYANGGGHIAWRIANTLEIEHAQRVLTRLANLTKDES